jgi:hypothetical protein
MLLLIWRLDTIKEANASKCKKTKQPVDVCRKKNLLLNASIQNKRKMLTILQRGLITQKINQYFKVFFLNITLNQVLKKVAVLSVVDPIYLILFQ